MVLHALEQQILVCLAERLRGHIHTVLVKEHPVGYLAMPNKSVATHLDIVRLGEGENVVAGHEIEVPFGGLSRIPFQVVAGRDAVVMLCSELPMHAEDVGLYSRESNKEIRRIRLCDGGQVL